MQTWKGKTDVKDRRVGSGGTDLEKGGSYYMMREIRRYWSIAVQKLQK